MTFERVSLIAHADWSVNPGKRWMAVAILQPDHHWLLYEPIKVLDPSGYFQALLSLQVTAGCILAGFDFPIGIPNSYADRVGISDFLVFLSHLGKEKWDQFYKPAQFPEEISLLRPFYPAKPGNSKCLHLEQGLGITFDKLYRLCERGHHNRRAACPLFWTLGGAQVGKAAICGWRDVLSPALADHRINLLIWPFSGRMENLCQSGKLVVVETYPAEIYEHLGLSFTSPYRKSKRRQADRLSFSDSIITWADIHNLELKIDLQNLILEGFGNSLIGEDQFDALVGLYGMISIVLGSPDAWEPQLPELRKIEGWIFGQSQPTGTSNIITNFL
jgi:hypothetical protein